MKRSVSNLRFLMLTAFVFAIANIGMGAIAFAEGEADSASGTSQEDFGDIRTPRYTHQLPNWGMELSGSMAALGTGPSSTTQLPNLNSHKISAFRAAYEYEPPMIQKFGVIGLGPVASAYMANHKAGISDNRFALWSIGAQGRYQARWFYQQPIVPYIGYSYERLAYNLRGHSGTTSLTGLFLGGMLYLNIFEPSAAADFYAGMGVLRTYLVAEYRNASATADGVLISGKSLFFGFRIEH